MLTPLAGAIYFYNDNEELIKEIERLRSILSSEKTIKVEVRKEIIVVKEKYGDEQNDTAVPAHPADQQ